MTRATHFSYGLGLLLLMSVVLVPAVPAFAAQSATSTKEIVAVVIEEEGTATGEGTAEVGTADADSKVIVIQKIIQRGGQRDNVTQIASNTATVFHGVVAISGDAHADEGAIARSGDARASATTMIKQLIIQIVAGRCRDEVVHQEAHQLATVDQVAIAVTGDALSPTGTAVSGDATAAVSSEVRQVSKQIYVCRPSRPAQAFDEADDRDDNGRDQRGTSHGRRGDDDDRRGRNRR